MLKKLSFILLSVFFFHSLHANIDCEPQLKPALDIIQKLPEAKNLIQSVLKEGPIKVRMNRQHNAPFGAFWGGENRTICVNCSGNYDMGQVIGSIIFELHNAAINSELVRYDNLAFGGLIDRNNYVRSIEYLEYQNSLKASAIVNKGIQANLYPKSAFLPTYKTFEIHFQIQQEGGHSAWIARNYDEIVEEARMAKRGMIR